MATAEAAGTAGDDTSESSPAGMSAFAARVFNQLSLSAWLPSALLTAAITLLLQFRSHGSLDLSVVAQSLKDNPVPILILALPVLVIATLVTQAFSFEAIRTLEGYWRRRGPSGLARTLMIRRHVRRMGRLRKRRLDAVAEAFASARPKLLLGNLPHSVVNALEAFALGSKMPTLTPEERHSFELLDWRYMCDAWKMARVDHLVMAERDYPALFRVLPTRLGNVIRATEDGLTTAGQDLEGFALRRRRSVSERVRQQHDQFRTRLDMYCILVFVSVVIAVLAPVLLSAIPDSGRSVLLISAAFLVLAFTSYQAAIASARGYCAALKQMDQVAMPD